MVNPGDISGNAEEEEEEAEEEKEEEEEEEEVHAAECGFVLSKLPGGLSVGDCETDSLPTVLSRPTVQVE